MEKSGDDDKDKEHIINFALLIQKVAKGKGLIQYHIQSQNQGILDPEIIMLVETWLEAVRENFKKGIKDNMTFGGKK